MAIRTTITLPPNAISAIVEMQLATSVYAKEMAALDEWLQERIAKLTAQTAIASPKRWHVGQKRATCLRLKARDN